MKPSLLLSAAVIALGLVAASASPPSVDAAAVALHDGNASNALALAEQALADPTLTPADRAHVLLDRGLAHEMLGERDAALTDFTLAINSHALKGLDLARAYYNRGVTLDEVASTEDAVGDYTASLRLEPKFAAALNNRGNAYRRLGKLPEARADYQASIAAGNPRPEYPNFGLGQIAEASGDPVGARRYYQAALKANPQFTLAQERIAALDAAPPPVLTAPPPAKPAPVKPVPAPKVAAAQPSAPVPTPPSTDVVTLRPPASPAPPADAPIKLRPPPGVAALADRPVTLHPPKSTPSADDAPITLKPPPGVTPDGAGPIRLHPPKPAAHRPAIVDLKPAIRDSAPRMLQLGAWRSENDAAVAWSAIARASGDVLAGQTPQIVAVDIPGKGRYYRLRTGPADPALCITLRARGAACIVVKD